MLIKTQAPEDGGCLDLRRVIAGPPWLSFWARPLRGILGRTPKNPELNLNEMLSFYHVVRLGSVTKAARYAGVGQNTVSQHLLRLEQEYRVEVFQRPQNQLIQRMKQPPTLTYDGAELLQLVTPIVEGVLTLKENMRRLKRDVSFSIGAYPELASDRLPSVIQQLQSRHPKAHLRITSSTHSGMIRQLKYGQLDVVIGIGGQDEDNLFFQPVFDSRIVLLVPRGHTLSYNPFPTVEDIAKWPLVFSCTLSAVRSRVESLFKDRQCGFHVAVDVEGANIANELVAMGTGVAFCADFAVKESARNDFDVIPLDHLLDSLTIGLLTIKGRKMCRSTQKLVATLRRELSRETATVCALDKQDLDNSEGRNVKEMASGVLAD